jgi:hypothetical protein
LYFDQVTLSVLLRVYVIFSVRSFIAARRLKEM